mmetsp:Transcript_124544/g.248452  ORF Transcript_124544/g.248452 Transcript_124544/m.248452 type:complete len:95 (+) Transcript_124544:1515-1799(+)
MPKSKHGKLLQALEPLPASSLILNMWRCNVVGGIGQHTARLLPLSGERWAAADAFGDVLDVWMHGWIEGWSIGKYRLGVIAAFNMYKTVACRFQ